MVDVSTIDWTIRTLRTLKNVLGRIVCPRCGWKGKIKCSCRNGWQSPYLEGGGYGSNFGKKGDDYFLNIHGIGAKNKGIGGTAMLRITVKGSHTEVPLYEYSKKVEVTGFEDNDFDIELNINLGKLEKLKDLLRREPKLADIRTDIDYNEYEPVIKCSMCNGKGFLVCPKCKGRRIRI
ncbi:MAG: hypothetical protein ABIH76_08315 [Candidatus Bathyarchaeota archaeon]